MSNQYVRLTGYNTLIPDKIGLCKTTPLRFGKREARSTVGPLPTDWPYNINCSSLTPYCSLRHLYAASMSAYVLHSDGCLKAKRQWSICEQYGKTFATNIIYMEFPGPAIF